MNELALFAGAGGGILGGKLLGWRTVCAVEIDEYARNVLVARQNDGCLEPFPIWDDVRTFDGRPWRGIVDVVSGGFPCQDISLAGAGAGITGEKSGLWREMSRVVCEVRPIFVFVENSPMLTLRGIDRVLGDLASMGYDAEWGVLDANTAGHPQRRERIWILGQLADSVRWDGEVRRDLPGSFRFSELDAALMAWQAKSEPPMVGMVDGMAYRMERNRRIGNGQIPGVAANAWRVLRQERAAATGRA
jgi:DNA (cytosine-5)-methyltransferase 1